MAKRKKGLTDCPIRWRNILKTFGITKDDYNKILEEQAGACFICGRTPLQIRPKRHLAVDHCHTTGNIRGLLCFNCNRNLIPFFERDHTRALRIYEYLTRKTNYGKVPDVPL